jgi:hypothetical protein
MLIGFSVMLQCYISRGSYVAKIYILDQNVDGIRVKPDLEAVASLREDQFNDTNEEQLLAPFTFIAVNNEVAVSNIFIL